jgi:hypothetical protein
MTQYHAVHVSQADSLACVYFNELPACGYVSYAVAGPLHNGRTRFQESYFTFIPCHRAATLAPHGELCVAPGAQNFTSWR